MSIYWITRLDHIRAFFIGIGWCLIFATTVYAMLWEQYRITKSTIKSKLYKKLAITTAVIAVMFFAASTFVPTETEAREMYMKGGSK